jgi:WD40 repeat protein
VVTASADKTARIWDAATGKQIAILRGHDDRVDSAHFSPDGRWVVTASADHTARVWDAGPAKGLATRLLGHKGAVMTGAFGPDGNQVVTGSIDKSARLWNSATGKELAILKGFARHGKSALRDGLVGGVRCVIFGPDGKRIVTVSADPIARIRTTELFGLLDGKEEAVSFTPVRIWDAKSGRELAALEGLSEGVRSAAFSPDGKRLLTVGDGQSTRAIISTSGSSLSFSNSSGTDHTARIWDARTGKQLAILQGKWYQLFSAAWSADGRRVCTAAGYPWHARVWDAATGKQLLRVGPRNGPIISAAVFSPDRRRLLTWNDGGRSHSSTPDKSAHLWDARTGKPIAALKGHLSDVNCAAFSADGKWIVTTAEMVNQSIFLHGLEGRWIDTNYKDRTARLWNAATGKLHAILRGHERAVHSAAFSPDGRYVVTASEDKTARIWEVATGKEYFTLRGHEDAVTSAAFSPNGKRVLTTSWDGTARIWPVDPLPLAVARKPRELTAEERERFEIDALEKS